MKRVGKSEDMYREFKSCKSGSCAKLPDDLWKSISAFANTRGGEIYLGVNDNGHIEKLSLAELDSLQKDVSSLLNGDFYNKRPDVEVVSHVDGYVIIRINESDFYNKPIYSKSRGERNIYIRQGSTTVKASEDQKKSLFAGASGGGENQLIIKDYHAIVDQQRVYDYIHHTGLKNIEGLSLSDMLRKLKALRSDYLTVFGLIAFGGDDTVNEYTNNVYIDFKYFNGKSKINENIDEIFKDRREFHGCIKEQFNQALDYLLRYIRRDWPVGGELNPKTGLREDVYVLPEVVFREAIANAIAHRDYMITSSCVNIDLYEDRVEITNPGESLVAIEDLDKTDSKSRNPILMAYLKTYRVTDKSARGILTMKQAARQKGLLDPKFENISGSFRATLYFSSPHTDDDKVWLDDMYGNLSLRDSQKNAIIFARNNQLGVSNFEYCEMNHMNERNDDRRARRELAQLVDYGIFEKTGANRNSRYILYRSDK